ncbi:hypothetical protein ACNOYE_15445 [Nannocystaceae bacterium ST9]
MTQAEIIRHPDQVLYDVIRHVTNDVAVPLYLIPLVEGLSEIQITAPLAQFDEAKAGTFLDSASPKSIYIGEVRIDIGNGHNIVVRRRMEGQQHDIIVLNSFANHSKTSEDFIKSGHVALRIFSSIVERLGSRGVPESTDVAATWVESHIKPIQQLEIVHHKIVEDLFVHRKRLEEDIANQRTRLEIESKSRLDSEQQRLSAEFEAKRAQLERDKQDLTTEIQTREQALEDRAKHIDDVDAKSARRKIRADLSQKFSDRAAKFELTTGTISLRTNVRVVAWIAAIFFATIEIILIFVTDFGPVDTLLRSMVQSFAGIGFAATVVFLIRWENRWFQAHADEEFYLKRLELDFDRASWLVEMSLEYAKERGTDLPPELLTKLSRGLFDHEQQQATALHPADQLASALLGSSAEAQLELANGSKLRLDRKGIRQLKKAEAAPPEAE